jgi:hypothetical protein
MYIIVNEYSSTAVPSKILNLHVNAALAAIFLLCTSRPIYRVTLMS